MSIDLERQLSARLFRWLAPNGYDYICPNVHLFGWESDLLAVSEAGYIVEYEIKRSTTDLRRDSRKPRTGMLESKLDESGSSRRVPSRFFYAAPKGVLDESSIPPFAGFVEVTPTGKPDIQRKAPRLTKAKATQRQRDRLARSLMYHAFDAWMP